MSKDTPKSNQRQPGWILIHRKIQDHWIMSNDKYFLRWIKILLNVNYKSAKFLIGNELNVCEPGSSFMSLESWGGVLKTDKTHVKKFFELLQNDGMILCQILGKGNQRKHLLTVVNWKEYQITDTENETRKIPETRPENIPENYPELKKNRLKKIQRGPKNL
jgi:hypothetical protein